MTDELPVVHLRRSRVADLVGVGIALALFAFPTSFLAVLPWRLQTPDEVLLLALCIFWGIAAALMLPGAFRRLFDAFPAYEARIEGLACGACDYPGGLVPWSVIRKIAIVRVADRFAGTSVIVIRLKRWDWSFWRWHQGPGIRLALRGLTSRERQRVVKDLNAWRRARARAD